MTPGLGRSTPLSMDAVDTAPRKRIDAQRNVVALVDAAKAIFEGVGVDAPAKQITERAGVGVGTLYRHFPRRSDLILAVMQHEIDECVATAGALGATLEPLDALLAWIDRLTDLVTTKQGLAAALHSGDPAYDGLPQLLLGQLIPALEPLVARAVDEGLIRDDVTARDVVTTVALLSHPLPGGDAGDGRRMARVFIDGLSVHAR